MVEVGETIAIGALSVSGRVRKLNSAISGRVRMSGTEWGRQG